MVLSVLQPGARAYSCNPGLPGAHTSEMMTPPSPTRCQGRPSTRASNWARESAAARRHGVWATGNAPVETAGRRATGQIRRSRSLSEGHPDPLAHPQGESDRGAVAASLAICERHSLTGRTHVKVEWADGYASITTPIAHRWRPLCRCSRTGGHARPASAWPALHTPARSKEKSTLAGGIGRSSSPLFPAVRASATEGAKVHRR